ncbi:MAG: ribosome biogenesis GTP-binding protein YihA/YsxC [Bacteroidia bacterium]
MKEQIISTSVFLQSCAAYTECPRPDKPEFAFIGRSNVGKSSLINMLCNHKGLAKVSGTPGKTVSINHFLINDTWYWVDLPGYGYAKRSRNLREAWETAMRDYFLNRENLMTVFVLVDSRIPPQKADLDLINNLGEHAVPLTLVFTKIDKNSKNETSRNIAAFNKALLESWEELPPSFHTSSIEKTGRNELISYIKQIAKTFKKPF